MYDDSGALEHARARLATFDEADAARHLQLELVAPYRMA